ncbi:M3 family oligoendopeptidase [Patescibacteria group bacterium]|nr:M3 family oligoendopeptidase [Patescibacteria group bacterium]
MAIQDSTTLHWNLQSLYHDDNDPNIDRDKLIVKRANLKFIKKWQQRADYLTKPKILLQALNEYEELEKNFGRSGKFGYYFWLRAHLDQNNPQVKAKYNQITEFAKDLGNQIRFFTLNIAKIPQSQQSKFLRYSGLKKYRHFLETSWAFSPYLLSEEVEQVLNLKATTSFNNWVKMVAQFLAQEERNCLDANGKPAKQNFSQILSLLSNADKKIRDDAARAFNDILAHNVEVAEAEINSILADKKIDDSLRKMPRPDLYRHLEDDIDSQVVDVLMQTVAEKFYLAKRFYQLKAKLLKVKKLAYHERNVEYGQTSQTYTFAQAVELVGNVFTQLDPQFAQIFHDYLHLGQVDVLPKTNKQSGAFCIYDLPTAQVFVLLNFTNKLSDVTTLAHEFGHAINNELIKQKQHALDFGTPLATAEVASTFTEDFVLQRIWQEADAKMQLSLMMSKLNDDVSSIFRQVACYRFEQHLHQQFREKGYLSKEEIGKLFQKQMQSYMGEAVEQSPGSENWWVYWSHIRRFFYVYSYASGLLISKSLQAKLKKDPQFIEKIKQFLAAGYSESPSSIFKQLGIDITKEEFWKEGLQEIEDLLNQAEKLSKKLGVL